MARTPTPYRIVLRGRLSQRLCNAVEPSMRLESGEEVTTLTGEVTDQSELQGLLTRVNDLGLELVSVNPVEGAR